VPGEFVTLSDYAKAAAWISIRILFGVIQPIGAAVRFMDFVATVGKETADVMAYVHARRNKS
jgi:hypothetical protein